jgi:hypothetical protein
MSTGGGDQEVVQSSEPFAQQLPYVQQAFGLAGNRVASLGAQGGVSFNGYNNRGNARMHYNPYNPGNTYGQQSYSGGYNPYMGGTSYGPYIGGTSYGPMPGGDYGYPTSPPTGPGPLPPVVPSTPGGVNPSGISTNNFSQVFHDRAQRYGLPTLDFYPGQTVANQSIDTMTGQALARGGAGNIALNNEAGTAALNRLLQNPDPTRDPTVARFADAATRPLYSQMDSMLSQDDDRAISQGAFGGSRQNLTRGQIRNDFAQRIGDVRAGIYNQSYQQQLQAQQNALGQLGAVNSQQTAPADIFSRIGAQNENFSQALIDAERERFDFEQSAPDLAINQFSNLVNQFSGPTKSQQVISGGGPSAFGTALGVGLTGAGAYGLFGGGDR